MRSLSLVLFAVLAAGYLKADIVTFGSNVTNGVGSVNVPGYYFTFGSSSCVQPAPPDGPYTCYASTGTMYSFEGYLSPLDESSTTVPGTLYVGGPAGNVTGEILTALDDTGFTCTTGNPPVSIPCASIFTDVQFHYEVGPTGQTCASVGGCIPYEPNVLQTLGTITYGDDTVFPGANASPTTVDFEYTPEPSLLIPLALGLGFTAFALRKRSQQEKQN
ncbi:MAG: PEP-CTERM sorting domain-containing protein [Bryobacteraceae bacterium]